MQFFFQSNDNSNQKKTGQILDKHCIKNEIRNFEWDGDKKMMKS